MKILFPLLSLALIFLGCSKDSVTPGRGSARFSMSQVNWNSQGGRIEASLTPASVLISIKDMNGTSVLQDKKLDLFVFGQGFESETIALNEGNYELTQFQILNAIDEVIYASPLAGSSLAQYVSNPLPIPFTVDKNSSTLVVPQVLAVTATDNPANFGYANFSFDVVSVVSSGLVAHFKFAGDTKDYSGQGNDLTVNYMPTSGFFVNDHNGNSMAAIHIDKGNFLQSVKTTNFSHSQSASISVWLNPTLLSVNGTEFIISQQTTSPTLKVWSGLGGMGAVLCFPYIACKSTSSLVSQSGWHHLVSQLDGTNKQLRLYLDNLLVDTRTLLTVDYIDSLDWAIGATVSNNNVGGYWSGGDISDLRVYNRLLTVNEIDVLYHQ